MRISIVMAKFRCPRISPDPSTPTIAIGIKRFTPAIRALSPRRRRACISTCPSSPSSKRAGIALAYLTLHVGAGTFQPVDTEDLTQHRMHRERFSIPAATVAAIERARAGGHNVIAVGTTSLRALESSAASSGNVAPGDAETALFITPGYRFRVVDRLLTNFHLPRSTLLMLVSAFAGYATIRAAYAHAIRERYRFFSYGDAMLLEPERG